MPEPPTESASGPATVRVASYNLYLGADLTVVFDVAGEDELADRAGQVLAQLEATDFPARAEAIAAILVRDGVDLVGLQEVARWSRRGPGEQARVLVDFLPVLLDALERAGEAYDAHAVAANFHGGAEVGGSEVSVLGHDVVLVRRASGITVRGEHTAGFVEALKIRTGVPGIVFEVARGWSRVDVEVHGRRLRFVNTHLEAWDETIRDAQREELLDVLRDSGGTVVLVGDFNATPGGFVMPPEYVDAWAVGGSGRGATSGRAADLRDPDGVMRARIDYVFVRGGRVETCRVVGAEAADRTPSGLWPSDHAGVVAVLTV